MPTIDKPYLGYSAETYFGLVHSGELAPDDHVELLEGVIVAEPPQDPAHATAIMRLSRRVRDAVGNRALMRVQLPFVAGPYSVPEPDIAVVEGRESDYETRHPAAALLIVEASFTSLPQDRLSKQRIYAAAGCPEYWILNLREECLEVHRAPDIQARAYSQRFVACRGDEVEILALPGARIRVADLLPEVSA